MVDSKIFNLEIKYLKRLFILSFYKIINNICIKL